MLQRMHGLHDRGDDTLVPDCSVDHEMVEATRRPVRAEIALHKRDSIAVNRFQ